MSKKFKWQTLPEPIDKLRWHEHDIVHFGITLSEVDDDNLKSDPNGFDLDHDGELEKPLIAFHGVPVSRLRGTYAFREETQSPGETLRVVVYTNDDRLSASHVPTALEFNKRSINIAGGLSDEPYQSEEYHGPSFTGNEMETRVRAVFGLQAAKQLNSLDLDYDAYWGPNSNTAARSVSLHMDLNEETGELFDQQTVHGWYTNVLQNWEPPLKTHLRQELGEDLSFDELDEEMQRHIFERLDINKMYVDLVEELSPRNVMDQALADGRKRLRQLHQDQKAVLNPGQ